MVVIPPAGLYLEVEEDQFFLSYTEPLSEHLRATSHATIHEQNTVDQTLWQPF